MVDDVIVTPTGPAQMFDPERVEVRWPA